MQFSPVTRKVATAFGWLLVCALSVRVLSAIIEPTALASLTDDSSNYLVMAQCFSPWSMPGVASSICGQQYFPAGFPLLLAVLGAASSIPLGHGVVLVCYATCLPGLWCHAWKVLGSRTLAHLAVMCFAVLPGTLLGLQGVLSESFYLLLVAVFFCLCGETLEGSSLRRRVAAGVVLGLVVGVRSIGVVLLLSVLAHAIVLRLRGQSGGAQALPIVGAAGLVFAVLHLSFPPASSAGDYASLWAGLFSHPPKVFAYVHTQANALVDAWASFLALYWTSDRPLAWIGMMSLLAVCLLGAVVRLRANRLDAWYVAGYVAVLILWPFPGQMVRFLFPVMPVLLLQGAWFLAQQVRIYPQARLAAWFMPALMLALAIPSHAFLLGRAEVASQLNMNPVYEWFRKPDVDDAKRELSLQNAIVTGLSELKRRLPERAVVAYYEPSYVVLLGRRSATALTFPVDETALAAVERAGASHVLLTRVHPRMSRASIDGLATRGALPGIALLGCVRERLNGSVAGCAYALTSASTDSR